MNTKKKHGKLVVAAILALCALQYLVLRSDAEAEEIGLWTSNAELATIPMEGEAWLELLTGADSDTSTPDVANQDDNTNARILAASIVYARTGDAAYRDKVVAAIETLVNRGFPGGRTLAWARETGAYALAADLIDYRTSDFETWLRNMAEVYVGTDNRTLLQMYKQRPNNWGTHAFGSLSAIYGYLNDSSRLNEVRSYFVSGIEGPDPGYKWGSDMSWHPDPTRPRLINPSGSKKQSMDIDGVMPDDMRRGGSFSEPPAYTQYQWEALQGLVMGARIMDRLGMSVWESGDCAIYRAAYCLQVKFANSYSSEWQATGDDLWMLPFLDKAYGTTWSNNQDRLWRHGKNAGWGYVTLATKTTATDDTSSDDTSSDDTSSTDTSSTDTTTTDTTTTDTTTTDTTTTDTTDDTTTTDNSSTDDETKTKGPKDKDWKNPKAGGRWK